MKNKLLLILAGAAVGYLSMYGLLLQAPVGAAVVELCCVTYLLLFGMANIGRGGRI